MALLLLLLMTDVPVERHYFTQYGLLTLRFDGERVVGSYPHEEGRIEGTARGEIVEGIWRQRDGGGTILMTFTPDFQSFRAAYTRSTEPGKSFTNWSGIRKPETIRREYRTPWGALQCIFEGTQLSCSYPWFNGRILGEIKGRSFRGLWLQSNGGVGLLNLEFSPDLASFKGTYNDFNFHPDRWNEWAGTASGR